MPRFRVWDRIARVLFYIDVKGEVEAIAVKRVLAWAAGAGDAEAAQNETGDGKGASHEPITA
jgi:hypothetical protein